MAFVRQQNSVNYIFLMDVDASGVGSNPGRLTNDMEAENYPAWTPDGKRLAYQRDFNGSAIYVRRRRGWSVPRPALKNRRTNKVVIGFPRFLRAQLPTRHNGPRLSAPV